MAVSPFDYVTDILVGNKNLMRKTENDRLAEHEYNPWLTNIALSNHADSLMIANILNSLSHLDNRPQYEIALNAVRKRKRPFQKWHKIDKTEDLTLICDFYNVNRIRGKEYLSLITKEQLNTIRESRSTGGTKK